MAFSVPAEAYDRFMGRYSAQLAAQMADLAGVRTPLAPFWNAARELDPDLEDESGYAGGREGHLRELFADAGLHDIEDTVLPVHVEHASFDEWWEPFTLGVGPAGVYLTGLDAERQAQLQQRTREKLPTPLTWETRAWAARGIA